MSFWVHLYLDVVLVRNYCQCNRLIISRPRVWRYVGQVVEVTAPHRTKVHKMVLANAGRTGIKNGHWPCIGCLEATPFPFTSRWWGTARLGKLPAEKLILYIVNCGYHAMPLDVVSSAITLNVSHPPNIYQGVVWLMKIVDKIYPRYTELYNNCSKNVT